MPMNLYNQNEHTTTWTALSAEKIRELESRVEMVITISCHTRKCNSLILVTCHGREDKGKRVYGSMYMI